MIVLDASSVVELLLRTEVGDLVARRIAPPGETLHAPHLLDVEVLHTLRRYALKRQLTPERADEAVDDLTDLDVARYPHDVLARRIWELRRNTTCYDAAYLALAETLGAPLLTCDARLREVPGIRVRVEVLA